MNVYGREKDRDENKITIWVAGKTQDQRAMVLVDWSRKLGRPKHKLGRGLGKSGRTQASNVGSSAVGAEADPSGMQCHRRGPGASRSKTRGSSGREESARCGGLGGDRSRPLQGLSPSSGSASSRSSARRPERAAPLNPCKQSFVPGPLPPRAPARTAPPTPAPDGSGR